MSYDCVVRIQHHPSRAHLLPRLFHRLDGLAVEVVHDPRPDELPSALRTYRECVVPTEASHILVLQDDTVPCRHFAYALDAAIRNFPDRLICLCVTGASRAAAVEMRRAWRRGEPFVTLARGDWVPTVALVWPAELALHFSAYLKRVDEAHWADDPIIGGWATRYRHRVVATVPSLVQHPDLTESILERRPDHKDKRGRGSANRRAAVWEDDFDPMQGWPCGPPPLVV